MTEHSTISGPNLKALAIPGRPPATLLLAPLGLAALGLAWNQAAYVFSLPTGPGGLITGFAAGLLALLLLVAAMPGARRDPADTSVAIAAASVTAVLLAGAALPRAPGLSLVLWLAGTAGLVAATAINLLRLIHGSRHPLTLRPALFLLPCGFLATPVAGTAHGLFALAVPLYLLGLALALALYALALAHAVSGWLLQPPAAIERAARTAVPVFAFFGYQGINGGFADPTAVILAALAVPVLGETLPALRAATRSPADPRSWLSVLTAAFAALLLLILYEWIGGAVLATVATLALAAASFAGLYAFTNCLSAATRGTARHPYRQPPPAAD